MYFDIQLLFIILLLFNISYYNITGKVIINNYQSIRNKNDHKIYKIFNNVKMMKFKRDMCFGKDHSSKKL